MPLSSPHRPPNLDGFLLEPSYLAWGLGEKEATAPVPNFLVPMMSTLSAYIEGAGGDWEQCGGGPPTAGSPLAVLI